MPMCDVRIYQDSNGDVPFNTWLMSLTQPSKRQNLEGATRVRDHLLRLAKEGHALRRPASAPLADGIHELRARVGTVNFRVLYFFAGAGLAVIALGCTKEGEVEESDIARAVRHKHNYEKDPQKHTYVVPASP